MLPLLSLMFSMAIPTFAATSLDRRAAQSQAICSPDFGWATNSKGLSPCSLTAYVWGACFTGNWNVPSLRPDLPRYTQPNSTTANVCTCSWAAYNLISACTACQGFDTLGVDNWAAYSQSCGSFLSNTYFPSTVVLSDSAVIPYWATRDPRTWNNGHFDTSMAKALADEHKPDLDPNSNSSQGKTKAPIGAIVGGVIGGLAVLVLGGIVFYYLTRKRNHGPQQLTEELDPRPYMTRPQIHGRSLSDLSGKSILAPQSMTASQRPTTVYTTGTMHTNTGSVHSLSYNSGYMSPVREMSPPSPQAQLATREDIIAPYVLRSTSPPVSVGRKGSETALNAAYNREAATDLRDDATLNNSVQRVRRVNPPAYSPYPSPASSPEPGTSTPHRDPALGHRNRYDKGSVDTQQSYESGSVTSGNGESLSAIDDVVGRMGFTLPAESTMGGHTVSTGQSANIAPRPTHKPGVSNPDIDTLA